MFATQLRRPAAVLAAALAIGVAAAPAASAATAAAPGAPTASGVIDTSGGVIAKKNDGRFSKSSEGSKKKFDMCVDMLQGAIKLGNEAQAAEKRGDTKAADTLWKAMDDQLGTWDSSGCGR